MINLKDVGVIAWLLAAWKEPVVEQIPNLLQFGALGVLLIVLMLLYRIAEKWLDFRIKQKGDEPTHVHSNLSYNEQMARTIYDVNKTLSEVAMANKQIVQQMERQTEIQDKQSLLFDRLVRLLDREHKLGMEGATG